MTRTLPTGLDAQLSAAEVGIAVFLVELHWPSGTVYAWNGYGTLPWGGRNWQGVGDFGGIASVQESSDAASNGVQLSLSGVPVSAVARALENDSQGQQALVYFGVVGPGGFVIDPYLLSDSVIDYASIRRDGQTATITIALEKELYDDRSNARRWTHEDQQIDFPGDDGLIYVAQLPNRQFTWGKATMAPAVSGNMGNPNNTEFE
jgi:hypothetical protein